MFPILLEWGPLVLPAWHVFFALGVIVAFIAAERIDRRAPHGVGSETLRALFLVVYVSGYLGARGLNILVEPESFSSPLEFLDRLITFGGMVFYGGLVAAIVAGFIFSTLKGLPRRYLFDLSCTATLLGLAIGRIGCFLNGCDYGKPTSASWGVIFPNLQDETPRIPTQLLESMLALLFFIVMARRFHALQKHYGPGIVGGIVILGYAVTRFFIEYWRDDPRGILWLTDYSTSQTISLGLFAGALLLLGLLFTRLKKSA